MYPPTKTIFPNPNQTQIPDSLRGGALRTIQDLTIIVGISCPRPYKTRGTRDRTMHRASKKMSFEQIFSVTASICILMMCHIYAHSQSRYWRSRRSSWAFLRQRPAKGAISLLRPAKMAPTSSLKTAVRTGGGSGSAGFSPKKLISLFLSFARLHLPMTSNECAAAVLFRIDSQVSC